MPVITLGSSKGGVGKTTLAMILASEIASNGGDVVIVDADPNQPFHRWMVNYVEGSGGRMPEHVEVISRSGKGGGDPINFEDSIIDIIDEAAARVPFVLVDLEGTANIVMNYALSRSDLLLIPLQPSSLDGAEAAKALKNARNMGKAHHHEIPTSLVFTRTSPAVRNRTLTRFYQEFEEANITVLPVEVQERQPFKAMFDYSCLLGELTDEHVSEKSLLGAKENAAAVLRHVLKMVEAKQGHGAKVSATA